MTGRATRGPRGLRGTATTATAVAAVAAVAGIRPVRRRAAGEVRRLRRSATGKALETAWAGIDPVRRRVMRQRMRTVLSAVTDVPVEGQSHDALARQLVACLSERNADVVWLSLAVLSGRLPDEDTIRGVQRLIALEGAEMALREMLVGRHSARTPLNGVWPTVRLLRGEVLVDLGDTARSKVTTGIQRVAREIATHWHHLHEPVFVGWKSDFSALVRLNALEMRRVLLGPGAATLSEREDPAREVVVPWGSCYILPELRAEVPGMLGYHAFIRHSRCTTSVVGFDTVPLTSAETAAEGMSAGFALGLVGIAEFDRVATISESAAVEYRGWRSMLGGVGKSGPDIRAVPLATEGRRADPESMLAAKGLLEIGDLPMVLVVGSHEPRKNHLAVLQAAELVWRDGIRFSLAFLGGNSWRSEPFRRGLRALEQKGRPIVSFSALTDELLWAAYARARVTLFPSVNEGFGLPVAESLAAGTPVITSQFGSMYEVAINGGCVMVDPHDDAAIASALKKVLTDDDLYDQLRHEAVKRRVRTWTDYATELWDYCVLGGNPGVEPA